MGSLAPRQCFSSASSVVGCIGAGPGEEPGAAGGWDVRGAATLAQEGRAPAESHEPAGRMGLPCTSEELVLGILGTPQGPMQSSRRHSDYVLLTSFLKATCWLPLSLSPCSQHRCRGTEEGKGLAQHCCPLEASPRA